MCQARLPASRRLPEGITAQTQTAIERGLNYLVRHQARDGAWSNQGRYGAYPVAMTSLAGLALLMDGNTTTQGRYAPNLDRASKFLLRAATPNGLIAKLDREARPMYGHGFATLFLGEAYGMSMREELREKLSKAIKLIVNTQNSQGGWRYQRYSCR